MQSHELELEAGDVVTIGGYIVTVLDIDGGEVTLRVETVETPEESPDDSAIIRPR